MTANAEVPGTKVLNRASLSEWTTLGVGGPAELLVEVVDVGTLGRVLAGAAAQSSPVLVLGGGSNVVIADAGFPGTVVHVGIKGCKAKLDGDTVQVSVGAGEDWLSFVRYCVDEEFSGVECLSGIPGLVGGTPVQNVGAYGQEVSEMIEAVTVWDRLQGGTQCLAPANCNFSYRNSIFKRNERYVVTEVLFRLERSALSQPLRYAEVAQRLGSELGRRPPLRETAAAVMALRGSKGMVLDDADPDSRSVGSFFTNPVLNNVQLAQLLARAPGVPTWPVSGGTKVPAAWLVERAGFSRGYRRGTAGISGKHTLALISHPGGSAADLIALAREVRHGVRRAFDVVLQPEPVLVGVHL
jgi:UDP-N-acetylmuramate dehydrogenase